MRRLLLVAILLAACSTATISQSSLKPGSDAPGFIASSLDGSYFDLDSMRGSVILITFWSTKCEICRSEIPTLNQFRHRYDQKGVVFLAPTMESEDRLEPFLKKNPFGFQVLPNSFGVVLKYADRDRNGNIDMGFPAYFLIDTNGKVVFRSAGWDKIKDLGPRIDQLLAAN